MDYIKITMKNEQNVARIPAIIHVDGEVNLVSLTEEQFALMEWLQCNVFDHYMDEDIFYWDVLEVENFKEIK